MCNIVKEPIVQARRLEKTRMNGGFGSANVVDISSTKGAIYVPSNGRIPENAPEKAPLSGAHKYATVVRDIQMGA